MQQDNMTDNSKIPSHLRYPFSTRLTSAIPELLFLMSLLEPVPTSIKDIKELPAFISTLEQESEQYSAFMEKYRLSDRATFYDMLNEYLQQGDYISYLRIFEEMFLTGCPYLENYIKEFQANGYQAFSRILHNEYPLSIKDCIYVANREFFATFYLQYIYFQNNKYYRTFGKDRIPEDRNTERMELESIFLLSRGISSEDIDNDDKDAIEYLNTFNELYHNAKLEEQRIKLLYLQGKRLDFPMIPIRDQNDLMSKKDALNKMEPLEKDLSDKFLAKFYEETFTSKYEYKPLE